MEFLPPREDVNSPDMYIPLMAFVTYILLSTLIAGLNGKFKPDLLGITFSNASVIIILELLLLWLGRYFLNISSESQIYDLIAYSGYKFVGVIVTIAVAAIVNRGQGTGGWVGWGVFAYTFMANAFFLVSLLQFTRLYCWRNGIADMILPHSSDPSNTSYSPLTMVPEIRACNPSLARSGRGERSSYSCIAMSCSLRSCGG